MHWMDLELCTRDGCENWPVKGWFHSANSLPEFFDLWGRGLVPQKRSKIRTCLGTWTVLIRWMDLELLTRDPGCKNWLVKSFLICDVETWCHVWMFTRQSKTHILKSSGFWLHNIITHWGHSEKGMQNQNEESKNCESNRMVIIAINGEFD